jgi:hypothetical protein
VKGDPEMAEDKSQGAFADLQSFIRKLVQYAGQVDKLTAEARVRRLQEMKAHVQQFTCLSLPLELADDAPEGSMTAPEHFAWLKTVDDTEGQRHWAFFNEVLMRANAALEGGSAGEPLDDDELHQRAKAYAKEHGVDYLVALKAVAAGATVNGGG